MCAPAGPAPRRSRSGLRTRMDERAATSGRSSGRCAGDLRAGLPDAIVLARRHGVGAAVFPRPMTADFTIESLDTDILILGAGGAGLCAALHAADRAPRLSIAVAVKGLLGRAGCTRMVQGGLQRGADAPRLPGGALPRHAPGR